MTQEFIKYEQALALKELGFDEPCFGYFNNTTIKGWLFDFGPTLGVETLIFAPTFSQAFRWFREKHNLYSEILVDRTMEPKFVFTIHTHPPEFNWGDKHLSEYLYRTYKEAEQACLDKLIEIVKNK